MDAPKKIWAWPDRGDINSSIGRWSCNVYSSDLTQEYILVAEHERVVAEARNKALEDALTNAANFREIWCLASPDSDDEFRSFLEGFDFAVWAMKVE